MSREQVESLRERWAETWKRIEEQSARARADFIRREAQATNSEAHELFDSIEDDDRAVALRTMSRRLYELADEVCPFVGGPIMVPPAPPAPLPEEEAVATGSEG